MLIEKAPPLAQPDNPIWTTTIMTYELGSLIRALVRARAKSAWGDHKSEKAYLAEARIEAADLLTQLRFLAEQMGWKMIDLENDGQERFCERMDQLENGL